MSIEFNTWFPSSRYGSAALNVKDFGAIGNGNHNTMTELGFANVAAANAGTGGNGIAYPKATVMTDTADWCGIQAAIDYALDPTRGSLGQMLHVHIPEGRYFTSDTIHLGYGMINGFAAFHSIQLSGAGWTALWETGTFITPLFLDRPVINIQSGRESGVRKLYIIGNVLVPDYYPESLNFRANGANYVVAGAKDDRYAPFCGVCIDAYYTGSGGASTESTETPPTAPNVPYPAPRYPTWVFSSPAAQAAHGAKAYNKGASSQPFVEDCYIRDMVVAICLQPWGDGNGDFMHCRGSQVTSCKVGVSVGNSQARSMDFSNMLFENTHTCFSSNYGHGIPNFAGTFQNIHCSTVYQFFNIIGGNGGTLLVDGLYGESCTCLGIVRGHQVVFRGCHGTWHDSIVTWPTKAISGIVRSGTTVTVTTVATLASWGWTLDGTTWRTIISGATPAEYNGDVWGTRTGANTFTYQIATTPGAYTGGASLTVPVVGEWLLRPLFDGAAEFDTCYWRARFVYHFTRKCEFRNTIFQNPEGHEANDLYMLSPGVRKAVGAMGHVFNYEEPIERAGPSAFTGRANQLHGRTNYDPEAIINGWDGQNNYYGRTLWGTGQRDERYSFEYDVKPFSRCPPIVSSYGAISGITRSYTPPVEIAAWVEIGDIIVSPNIHSNDLPFPWYAVDAVGAGPTYTLTLRQITDFTMESGVYTSLQPTVGTGNPTYIPIGVLDLRIPSSAVDGEGGIFLKTTAGSAALAIVDGSGAAVATMPSGLTEKSKPLWTGNSAKHYADTLPFPAHTYIASGGINTTTKIITMTANALTTGTWAYGPGIKRLK